MVHRPATWYPGGAYWSFGLSSSTPDLLNRDLSISRIFRWFMCMSKSAIWDRSTLGWCYYLYSWKGGLIFQNCLCSTALWLPGAPHSPTENFYMSWIGKMVHIMLTSVSHGQYYIHWLVTYQLLDMVPNISLIYLYIFSLNPLNNSTREF